MTILFWPLPGSFVCFHHSNLFFIFSCSKTAPAPATVKKKKVVNDINWPVPDPAVLEHKLTVEVESEKAKCAAEELCGYRIVDIDAVFIQNMLQKLEKFYKSCILPEIILRRIPSQQKCFQFDLQKSDSDPTSECNSAR